MKLSATAPRRRRSPSLIPLIDVMLVLLFFFMLAGATVHYGRTRVEFTRNSSASSASSTSGPIGGEVLVLDDGNLRINGQTYNVPAAVPIMRSLNSGGELRLIPTPGVPLQNLLQLWERLRGEGISSRLGEARASP